MSVDQSDLVNTLTKKRQLNDHSKQTHSLSSYGKDPARSTGLMETAKLRTFRLAANQSVLMNRMTKFLLLLTIPAIVLQTAPADDAVRVHPSTHAQVRLASWWFARHAEKVAEIEAANDPKQDRKIDLLMVGDSITNNFDKGGPGADVWQQYFAPLNALNLGFGGDRTNHVLWRLEHLPELKTPPAAASVMIGTNNICWGSDQPSQAADGVQAIARRLNQMYPDMQILVVGVFPRRRSPDHPHRKQIVQLNSCLPDLLRDIPNVTYVDIGEKFLDDKGFLSAEMMPDTTHPSERGHEIWAQAIVPTLKKLMKR